MWSSARSGHRSDRAGGVAADSDRGDDDDDAVLDDHYHAVLDHDDDAVLDDDHIHDDAVLDDDHHTLLDDDDHAVLDHDVVDDPLPVDDDLHDDAVLDDDHVDDPAPDDDHYHDGCSEPEGADLSQGQIDHGRRERRRQSPEPRGYVGPVPVAGSRKAHATHHEDAALLEETRCRD